MIVIISNLSTRAILCCKAFQLNQLNQIFFCILLCIFFFLPGLLHADAVLLKSEDGGQLVELKFDAGNYDLIDKIINGEKCTSVKLKSASSLLYTRIKGFPALPYFTNSIAIPGAAEMGFEIISQTVEELAVNKIVPSRGSFSRKIDPATVPYTFGDIYHKDEWYPGKPVALGKPYILNDIRGLVVSCYPFQYNPEKGILKITTSITIRVKQTATSTFNVLTSKRKLITPVFNNVYSRQFINFDKEKKRYNHLADSDKMIVIAASALKNAVMPLVEWKNQKGIATKLYEYPSQTGNEADALANFIKNRYSADGITYVLLVGDHSDIPPPTKYDEGLSDPLYALVNGTDSFPDIFIGRMSSSNANDITALVNKTIKYEKNPDSRGDWYQKAIGIASDEKDEENGQSDKDLVDSYRTKLEAYGYTHIDKIYDPGATEKQTIDAINQGRSWLSYMGHGLIDCLETSQFCISSINSLTNYGMPFIGFAVACLSGKFEANCIAEALTNVPEKGAVVFVASTIEQNWVPPQIGMTEMIDLLTNDKCLSVGSIFYNGECKMLEANTEGDESITFKTWTYFGDPSLMQFTKKPKNLIVTAPKELGLGNQQVNITFNEAITGHVGIYDPYKKVLLGSKTIATKSTSVSLSLVVPEDTWEVILTVTGFNCVTNVQEIVASSGPYLRAKLDSTVYNAGSHVTIRWISGSGSNIANVKMEYSIDGGKTYSPIIESIPAVPASYNWTVPDVIESDSCLIRISEVGGQITGTSRIFAINQNSSISLESVIEKMIAPNDSTVFNFKIKNNGKGSLTYSIKTVDPVDGKGRSQIINEIYTGDGIDGVEIWNQNADINMSGWKLVWNDDGYSSGSFTFPSAITLSHNKTLILMDTENQANSSDMLYIGSNLTWNSNTSISISLLDANGKAVDFIRTFGNTDKLPEGAKWIGDGIKLGGQGVYRISGIDLDNASEWNYSDSLSKNAINPGQKIPRADWLKIISSLDDTIKPLQESMISLKLSSMDLALGNYTDTITITHNSPNVVSPVTTVIKLIVTEHPGKVVKNYTADKVISLRCRNEKSAVYFLIDCPSGMKKDLKIFNLLGHLVYEQSGEQIEPWRYINSHGTTISRGVYYAIVNIYNRNSLGKSENFRLWIK